VRAAARVTLGAHGGSSCLLPVCVTHHRRVDQRTGRKDGAAAPPRSGRSEAEILAACARIGASVMGDADGQQARRRAEDGVPPR